MGIATKAAGFASALAVVSTATIAAAASVTNPPSINPFAIIGLYGAPEAAGALCANAATAAVVGVATTTQQDRSAGCVLPITDPPPVPADPAPPGGSAIAGGPGVTPLLLGLVGIAGIAALIASQDGDDRPGRPTPISPN